MDSESRSASSLAGMFDPFSGGAAAMFKDSTGRVRSTVTNVADSFDWDITRCPTMTGAENEHDHLVRRELCQRQYGVP